MTARALSHQLQALGNAGLVETRSAGPLRLHRLRVRALRPILDYLATWEVRQPPSRPAPEEDP